MQNGNISTSAGVASTATGPLTTKKAWLRNSLRGIIGRPVPYATMSFQREVSSPAMSKAMSRISTLRIVHVSADQMCWVVLTVGGILDFQDGFLL